MHQEQRRQTHYRAHLRLGCGRLRPMDGWRADTDGGRDHGAYPAFRPDAGCSGGTGRCLAGAVPHDPRCGCLAHPHGPDEALQREPERKRFAVLRESARWLLDRNPRRCVDGRGDH